MADAPDPHDRNSPSPTLAPSLRYPTFPPLSASVEEWLSQSRPANMTSTPHTHRPSSSLSESWATLSASDVHSEDGSRSEQTDIGSLISQNGPDDVASLDERESSSEVDGNDDEQSNISESQELPPLFARVSDDINDSNLTMKAAYQHPSESIEFREPDRWPEIERVELKHTIRIFDGAEASELKERLPHNLEDTHLIVTVQQTMTKQSLDLDKPFRVLYVGNPEFRHIVLDKIGDVLVSSSRDGFESSSAESSRYHVVPTSFGAGATPNFAELLPIHVQLIVDECLDATSEPRADKPSTINLKFKNRPPCSSSWTGSQYQISSSSDWTLPDVAIFFMSEKDDSLAVRTRKLAHTFMKRHGIPAMVISEEPLWKRPADLVPLDYHSLHMCLESRHSLTGETVVLRRYPIDLKTFESITPGQLNRNLASLSGLYTKKTSKVIAEDQRLSGMKQFFDSEKYPKHMSFSPYTSRAHELQPVLRVVTLSILSAIAITLGYTALKAILLFLVQFFARSAVPNLPTITPSSISTTGLLPAQELKQTSLSLKSSSLSEVQTPSCIPDALSTAEEIMGISLSLDGQSDPDKFQIQVVGDCHVIIKPPNSFTSARKQPKFNVSVTRGDKALSYELSKLFDGVYTLKLDREDAYGLLNVSIATTSKPFLQQVTEVDFGTPWMKIANWKKAAQVVSSRLMKDLGTAQTGLSEVYDRLSMDLQVWMGDAVKRSHFLRREAETLRRDSMQLTLETRDAVLSRSKQLSEVIKRGALQQFSTASSTLRGHTTRLNKDAKTFVDDAWKRLLSTSTQRMDLGGLRNRMHEMRKSKALAKAQMQARCLLKRGGHQCCARSSSSHRDCNSRACK
ncbi:hypothetical protein VTN00DRAFT_4263 [Thermoascus crustaceus]|uniref:uncharacterized protein n=1 Tax=Thermoascus crustaceus TaxID=5088 RepID=UPI0037449752